LDPFRRFYDFFYEGPEFRLAKDLEQPVPPLIWGKRRCFIGDLGQFLGRLNPALQAIQ